MTTNPEFIQHGIDDRPEPLHTLTWDIVSGALVGGLGGSVLVMLNDPLPALPMILGGSIVMGSLGAIHWLQKLRGEEGIGFLVTESAGSHLAPQRRQQLAENPSPPSNGFNRDATPSVAFKILNKSRT